MTLAFVAFALGWFGGAAAMWAHFRVNKLIRSREEWYRARGKT